MSPVDSIIPGAPAGDFSAEDWTDRVAVLRAAEPVFRTIAGESNLRLLSSARWPELRLQRKRGWSIAELRLELQPNDHRNQAGIRLWSINQVQYPRFAWLPLGSTNAETIAVISDSELCSGDWDQDSIKRAVRRLAGG